MTSAHPDESLPYLSRPDLETSSPHRHTTYSHSPSSLVEVAYTKPKIAGEVPHKLSDFVTDKTILLAVTFESGFVALYDCF